MPSVDSQHLRYLIDREHVQMQWVVYILECADCSLYTGITNDLAKRLDAHNRGKGATYTRIRRPLSLRYQELHLTKGSALSREATIKSLTRSDKLALIAAGTTHTQHVHAQ